MLHVREPRTLKAPAGASTLSINDITSTAAALPAFDGHERVWHGHDAARGLDAIVAIHDTRRGPALGGTRIWPHESFEAALTDALRLSRGMTFKSAIAGTPFGGGKAVIIADPKHDKSPRLLAAYAEMLAALTGQFITAEDVGLTLADADFLRARTPNVAGSTISGGGNPSPVTAHGVFLGIKAALKHRRGSGTLNGIRVAVQGLGAVGWALCEALHKDGAALTVADLDRERTKRAKEVFGASVVSTKAILQAEADVFAPCALGGVITRATAKALRAEIVAGSANNQLADHADARRLMELGILYAPDYVINAGGLINVAAELAPGGYDRRATLRRVERIPATLTAIFERAKAERRPTNEVAADIARERMEPRVTS